MSSKEGISNTFADLPWGLIFVLGLLGLVRPLLSILGISEGQPVIPVAVTILLSAMWIGVVVWQRVPHAFLTLVAVGAMYAILAMVLNVTIQGGFSRLPVQGIVGILVTNLIWGAILGLIATAILNRWD